jgi:hypothetical protein
MDVSISLDERAIRAATMELSSLVPSYAAAFALARNHLLSGEWHRRGDLVVVAPGITAGVGHCNCPRGDELCLHKLAARILKLADERASGTRRPPDTGVLLIARLQRGAT